MIKLYKNIDLLAGLLVGVVVAVSTGQIVVTVGATLFTIAIVAIMRWCYIKLAKKLLRDNLHIATSKESPKYDGKGNGYQIVELKAKQRNQLYRLFTKGINFEVFVRVRFQWGEEKRDSFHCPADEISLGLDAPRRLFTVAFDKVAKLAIAIKSRDFILYSLKETDFCGEELEGDYTLTIVVHSHNEEFKPLELLCPVSIQKGDIVINKD